MPSRAIEIHDSVVESLVGEERKIVLNFSHAYIHESDERPGITPGTGWSQRATISICGQIASGGFSQLPCDLSGGSLTLEGEKLTNIIPVPLKARGEVALVLDLQCGESIQIRGNEIILELIGDAEYVEKFLGASWR